MTEIIRNDNYINMLKCYKIEKNDKSKIITNTSIKGGSYSIPDDKYSQFLQAYYNSVINGNKEEFLTEKQLENGPIAVDFDFRYDLSVKTKQYSSIHITSIIDLYLNILKEKVLQFEENETFPVYIFEKPNVNSIKDKNITKDGIHMIIGITMNRTAQILLRKLVLEKINEEWGDLPLMNSWEDVIDEGVCKGCVNWQLYGSNKPNHDKYTLTHVFEYDYDEDNETFTPKRIKLDKFKWKTDFAKLSVRYTDHPMFYLKNDFKQLCDNFEKETSKPERQLLRREINTTPTSSTSNLNIMSISNKEELDRCVSEFLDSLTPSEFDLKEAHDLVMILPQKYYGNGSYEKWIRVGWCLKHLSEKLLISWIAFSARSDTFQYNSISELCEKWAAFDCNDYGLKKGSIIYWAKEDAKPADFKKVRDNNVDAYLNASIKNITLLGVSKNEKNIGSGDADIAKILHVLKKDQYVCASIKGDKWYRFVKHRWMEDDSGTSLRRLISDELRTLYRKKCDELSGNLCDKNQGDDKLKMYENLANKVLEIIGKLGQTTHKDHILKEAKELFFDPDTKFLDLLDSNPWLMCFKNGVLDIKEGIFRPGRPDDYLEKSTNINYKKLDRERDGPIIAEINEFMEKIFPMKQLRDYMWEHLASLLVGINFNQKMHIYIGGGSNGKSVLTDLLGACFGDYYDGAVNISLITQARQKQGSASPDIVSLRGLRLAVMQEPSKDDKINDGAMKELTSGVEPIKGRQLFGMPIVFKPMCKIVVCSNNFMKVPTQDHGTWRRIAVIDYMSKFTENPEPDEDEPYQFLKDTKLSDRFPVWKEVFMAMLVEIALETKGQVQPCKMVDDSSRKYKDREDHISEFINEKIEIDPNGKIRKEEIANEFNVWFSSTYGRGGPTVKEVHEYMDKDKRFKKFKLDKKGGAGWSGGKIIYARDVVDTEDNIDNIDIDDM